MDLHFLTKIFDGPGSIRDALIIAGKTFVIYIFLILGLRLLGKRELGQMTIYDLVMIIILGNAVQNAMMNNDNTLGGGLIAATVLLVVNSLFNRLISRSKKIEKLMVGEPLLIVKDGKTLDYNLHKEGVTHDQLMAALREHGVATISEVALAVLEVDGSISIVPLGSGTMKTRRHFKAIRLP